MFGDNCIPLYFLFWDQIAYILFETKFFKFILNFEQVEEISRSEFLGCYTITTSGVLDLLIESQVGPDTRKLMGGQVHDKTLDRKLYVTERGYL